jgi:hypothetical protein
LSIVYTIHKRNARGKCEIVEVVMDTSLLFLPPYKRTEIFWAKVGGAEQNWAGFTKSMDKIMQFAKKGRFVTKM